MGGEQHDVSFRRQLHHPGPEQRAPGQIEGGLHLLLLELRDPDLGARGILTAEVDHRHVDLHLRGDPHVGAILRDRCPEGLVPVHDVQKTGAIGQVSRRPGRGSEG